MADTTNELLGYQLGRGSVTIIEDTDAIAAVTGVSYYVTGTDADLHRTYAAGTTLFLNFTAITLSGTGLALVYKNDSL